MTFRERISEYWQEWEAYRKQIKKPIKGEIQRERAQKKLYKLSEGNPDKAKMIIDNSISNGYQGLFPLKGQEATQHTYKHIKQDDREKVSFFDMVRGEKGDVAEKWITKIKEDVSKIGKGETEKKGDHLLHRWNNYLQRQDAYLLDNIANLIADLETDKDNWQTEINFLKHKYKL